MAGADRYAEAVRKATFGKETRGPIVSAIEYWLKSADRIRTIIRKEIEQEVKKTDDPEMQDAIDDFVRNNNEKVRDFVVDGEALEAQFRTDNEAKAQAFENRNEDKPDRFYNTNKDKPGVFYARNMQKAYAFYDAIKDKSSTFNARGQERAQDFYDRNHPSVDNKLSRLTDLYSARVKKIELKNPQPFPIGVRIDTDYTGLETTIIEGSDYTLNDTRDGDLTRHMSGDDYSLIIDDDWCENISGDNYLLKLGEKHVTIYDYDYTLTITCANGT